MKLYTIHDVKAKYYYTPMQCNTDEEAIRIIEQVVNDPTTTLHQHPEDYILMYVGDYDPYTGIITPASPHIVAPCINMVVTPKTSNPEENA